MTDFFRVLPKTGIECWLSATGLFCIILHSTACFFKNPDHIECRIRVKLINKTWYEKLNIQLNYLKGILKKKSFLWQHLLLLLLYGHATPPILF